MRPRNYLPLGLLAAACFTGPPSEGTAEDPCPIGEQLCGDVCVDVLDDARNCGECDHVCGSEQTCVSGHCACPAPANPCGDECADLGSDPQHCGACFRACAAAETCIAAQCVASGASGGIGGHGGSGTTGGASGSGGARGGARGSGGSIAGGAGGLGGRGGTGGVGAVGGVSGVGASGAVGGRGGSGGTGAVGGVSGTGAVGGVSGTGAVGAFGGGGTGATGGYSGSGGFGGSSGSGASGGSVIELDLIDDVDDGNLAILERRGRSGGWYSYNDLMGEQDFGVAGGGPGSSVYAMTTVGSGFWDWGAGMGLNLRTEGGIRMPYDASACEGVSFWATTPRRAAQVLRMAVGDRYTDPEGDYCINCYDYFGVQFTATDEWQQFRFGWRALTQQGWGDRVPAVDPTSLYNIQWQIGPDEDFALWIDDVAFVECRIGED